MRETTSRQSSPVSRHSIMAVSRRFLVTNALRLALCAPAALLDADPAFSRSLEQAAYPVRPIRIVVAASPGSADDFFARLVGEDLESFYKQRVIIDNRAGAGGLIGNLLVSRANADGYTLGM